MDLKGLAQAMSSTFVHIIHVGIPGRWAVGKYSPKGFTGMRRALLQSPLTAQCFCVWVWVLVPCFPHCTVKLGANPKQPGGLPKGQSMWAAVAEQHLCLLSGSSFWYRLICLQQERTCQSHLRFYSFLIKDLIPVCSGPSSTSSLVLLEWLPLSQP